MDKDKILKDLINENKLLLKSKKTIKPVYSKSKEILTYINKNKKIDIKKRISIAKKLNKFLKSKKASGGGWFDFFSFKTAENKLYDNIAEQLQTLKDKDANVNIYNKAVIIFALLNLKGDKASPVDKIEYYTKLNEILNNISDAETKINDLLIIINTKGIFVIQ